MQHVESLTEHWREINSQLGNIEILAKVHNDVRANELFHSKCLKTFQYHETLLNESKEKQLLFIRNIRKLDVKNKVFVWLSVN